MSYTFELGQVYCASPALAGARKRLMIPIGRQGDRMQIAMVDNFALADLDIDVSVDYGREFVSFLLADGRYSSSAACRATADQVALVYDRLGIRR